MKPVEFNFTIEQGETSKINPNNKPVRHLKTK